MSTEPANRYLPFGENKNGAWYGKDIISVKQFSKPDLEYVFGVAHEMRGMVERVGTFDLLKGKILANLFYEPSTRTSSSFTAAMERLGGSVIPINEVKYSSVSKGETLADTVRTLESQWSQHGPARAEGQHGPTARGARRRRLRWRRRIWWARWRRTALRSRRPRLLIPQHCDQNLPACQAGRSFLFRAPGRKAGRFLA